MTAEHMQAEGWVKVVFSSECNAEGDCPNCGIDYAECKCVGPTMDDYEYQETADGMYARKIRHCVKVTFANGDSLVSTINGTEAEVRAYYMNNKFNIGRIEDDMQSVVSVDFLN
jgi:hypothetical protein